MFVNQCFMDIAQKNFKKSGWKVWSVIKKRLPLHPLSIRKAAETVSEWDDWKNEENKQVVQADWLDGQSEQVWRSTSKNDRLRSCQRYKKEIFYNEEFDPGSGWTLATGLTHASRGAA